MSGRDTKNNLDAEPAEPTMQDTVPRIQRKIGMELRVSNPAHVLAFDPVAETVDVSLGHLPVEYQETPAGTVETPSAPMTIRGVPIVYPGAATAWVTFPVDTGSTGILIHTDRALLPWRESAVPGPVDPVFGRTHNLGDAVFIPGLAQTVTPRTTPVNPAALTLEGPLIQAGATATLGLAIASQLHTYLVAAITAAPTTAMDGGAAFKAGLLTYLGSNPFANFSTTKLVGE